MRGKNSRTSRALAVLMSIVLVVGLMPLPAFAEPGSNADGMAAGTADLQSVDDSVGIQMGALDETPSLPVSGTWGTCAWDIDASGVLTVHPGVGAEPSSTAACPWLPWRGSVKSVVFASSGDQKVVLPANCKNLFNFTASYEGAYGDPLVESIDLSGADSSQVTDMSNMFYGNRACTSIVFPATWDTSRVTNMSGMFTNCFKLADLDVSKFNTANVTNMTSVFSGCNSLTSINVAGFNTANVTDMQHMFDGCHLLAEINVSSFSTSNVTNMTCMFAHCPALKKIDLSSFDTSKVTQAVSFFWGSSSLEEADLSTFSCASIDGIDYSSGGMNSFFEGAPLKKLKLGSAFRFGAGDDFVESPTDDQGFMWINGDRALTGAQLRELTGADLAGTWTWEAAGEEPPEKISITGSTVALSATSFTYNGSVQQPTVTSVTLPGGGAVPEAGYDVTYSEGCVTAGTYTVTVTGKGDYEGTATATFEIVAAPEPEDPYNLGDETYSFANYGDSDSRYGHCFGMSATSAGYHAGLLDMGIIGAAPGSPLFALASSPLVRAPICHYQGIQGSYSSLAIVAGGSTYLTGSADIASDWDAVVAYVRDHSHDGDGLLQVGFRRTGEGGHAINFLRYESVEGQDRLYAYDNNFPSVETYFYRDAQGLVRQAPEQTFSGPIDCIALRDVRRYFAAAGGFDATHALYAAEGEVSVEGCEWSYMETDDPLAGEYLMYEAPAGAERVTVVPEADGATFTYMGAEYSFGEVGDATLGELVLASSADEGSGGSGAEFTVFEGDLSKAKVEPAQWVYDWEGKAITPSVTVKVDGVEVPASGYDVSYKDNDRVGFATVTVTGKAPYTGTASEKFQIRFKSPAKATIEQFGGATRFGTARMIVEAELELGSYSGAIIVAGDGQKFPDALSAAGLAGVLNYPLVMVDGSGLTSDSKAALKKLKAANGGKDLDLVIVGGTAAVSSGVQKELSTWGKVSERIGGATRYETNALVYEYGAKHGGWSADYCFIATGKNYPDALAIAPFLVKSGSPIVLVDPKATSLSSVPAEGRAAIEAAGKVVALGGEAAVSKAMYEAAAKASAGKAKQRLSGAGRYETAAEVLKWECGEGGMSLQGAGVATGANFADALSSGFLLGRAGAPIVLAEPSSLKVTQSAVKACLPSGVTHLRALGGDAAVPKSVREGVASALGMEKPATKGRK